MNEHVGSFGLLPPFWHHLAPSDEQSDGKLFQTSLMSALLNGVYEGTMTYGELHQHGDFGLGTFNDLDGEMAGIDGEFFQLRSDGSASLVRDEQRTPFAVVTFFRPDKEWIVAEAAPKQAVQEAIEAGTDKNLFSAIKVSGMFESVSMRTVNIQQRPYPPLTEATKHQAVTKVEGVAGTLIGFRTPAYAQGIGVAGFHLHFLRHDKQAGGHALDFVLQHGVVAVQTLHSFHVELPDSKAFLNASLVGGEINEAIKRSGG
jgi:acetolactate decarboxylase